MAPIGTDDFLTWYFIPEFATNENDKDFSERCIEHIKTELEDK